MVKLAGAKKNSAGAANVQTSEQKFSKEQLVASARYRDHRDLVDALLEEDKRYTKATVDKMIEDHMKRKVK